MDSLLDLSHLTEAEQSKILQVLQRDLDLRLLDEGRVRSEVTANPHPPTPKWCQLCTQIRSSLINQFRPLGDIVRGRLSSFLDGVSLCCRILQETETDQRLLRTMSGAWFTEERNKRHHTWSSSALVHATIRHKRTKSRGLSVCFPADTRVSL